MDLARLKVFYILAKAGSFTKAADVLNISQSAVSRSLQLFEHRIKTKLINRSPRGVTLTPEGQELFEFAQKFLLEADILVKSIHDKDREPQGELKIITSPGLGETWLMQYVPEFLSLYPKVNLSLILKTENIEPSQADVAIRSFIPHHPDLIQRQLHSFKMQFWASLKYLEKFGYPETVEELDKHRLLVFNHQPATTYANLNWILNVGSSKTKPRSPYLAINSLEGLVNATKTGLGIAELADDYVALKTKELIPVLPGLNYPVVDIYYIYPEKLKDSKRITAFADFLEQKIKDKN
jgi:DNA-binding transcriptional LysR family regulator